MTDSIDTHNWRLPIPGADEWATPGSLICDCGAHLFLRPTTDGKAEVHGYPFKCAGDAGIKLIAPVRLMRVEHHANP